MSGAAIEDRKLLVHGLTGVALLVLILILTNPYFSILEDETTIISAANAPVAHTLKLFTTGEGQHEHPPLSDLLLHFWLPVAGLSPSLVRLPFIILYGAGMLAFAIAAQKLGGATAFYVTLTFGMLWPFGFHFGRLAGWYSFCFLLVALLTLAYLHFLDSPTWRRWLLVLCAAFATVVSNYFCWFIVGFFLIDLAVTLGPRTALRYATPGLALLFVAYGPLWLTLAHEIGAANLGNLLHAFVATLLNAGFNLYTLFVSESVAPWFWTMSIPAGVAICALLIAIPLLLAGRPRRFYCGFLGLFAIMAATGIIGTKRLLFISGWLLLALGCAVANSNRPQLRALLAASLLVTLVVGWTGIVSRRYYSALHFVEPWAALAQRAAESVCQGRNVVSNSPAFLFYLNSSLHNLRPSPTDRPGWATGHGVVSLLNSDFPEDPPSTEVTFVRGVNTSAIERTARAEETLMSKCRLNSSARLLRDDGFALKKRYFHIVMEDPYRIHIEQFDCRH